MTPKFYLLRWLRRWHGRIGVLTAAFLVFLAVTGIALNHATTLGLNAYPIRASWLTHWYGLKAEIPTQGYGVGKEILVGANGRWLLGNKLIAENMPPPLGIVELDGVLYIATLESLYVYLRDGRRVDKISGLSLPALPIRAIGSARSQLTLQGKSEVYASADGLAWKNAPSAAVTWSRPVAILASEQDRIAALLAPSISGETLISDIHSGRILGAWGPIFVDLTALILIVLAISGGFVFLRSHRRYHHVIRPHAHR